MRIRRFTGPDMRQTIRSVRDALGADAVILSNRKTDSGVEITAAVDFDLADERPGEAPGRSLHDVARTLEATEGAQPKARAPQPAEPAPAPQPLAPSAAKRLAEAMAAYRREPAAGDAPTEPPAIGEELPYLEGVAPATAADAATMSHELRYLRDLLENQLGRLAWGEAERSDPLRAFLVRQLMGMGVHRRIAEQAVAATPPGLEAGDAWAATVRALTGRVRVTGDTLLEHGGVVALLGATGVGKTTTVAKLAARFAIRHGPERVALVTTDSYRVGAHEQLRTFGRIIDIPVVTADEPRALRQALEQFYDRRLVLVDTAGMSQRDLRFSEQIRLVGQGSPRIMNLLVLSATSEYHGAAQAMRAFGGARLDGCVLTKLDECTSLGNALSLAIEHDVPVAYLSDGQRVPEDLRPARPDDLVERAVRLASERIAESTPGRTGVDLGFEEAARA